MTDATFRTALNYARRGWPVFPCLPGEKIPATRHGFRDATTDPGQIAVWFSRGPDYNLAVATGAPGPDVLDVDDDRAGNGFPAFFRIRASGLADGAAAYVRTPSGGIHAYFAGSDQRSGSLPRHHLDFRAQGGYVLVPHAQIGDHPTSSSRNSPAAAAWTGPPSSASWNPSASSSGPIPGRPRTATWVTWPGGSPPSPKATATPACTGPLTAPWRPTPPPTSARWPPPPARPACPTPKSPGPWTPPAAPARPTPNHPITKPRR